jgi:hypothetical protein
MELSTNLNMDGWQASFIRIGLVVLGGFSIVILASFGGQVIAAPGLLPAQWLVARATHGWVSKLFAILGGLLLLEVVPFGAVVVLGESNLVWIGGFVVAVVGALAFYRTSQEHR